MTRKAELCLVHLLSFGSQAYARLHVEHKTQSLCFVVQISSTTNAEWFKRVLLFEACIMSFSQQTPPPVLEKKTTASDVIDLKDSKAERDGKGIDGKLTDLLSTGSLAA